MTDKQTFRFGSKRSCLQVMVHGAEPQRHQGSGVIIGRDRELVAEFGEIGAEFPVLDQQSGEPLLDPGTGHPMGRTANARGHYFDSRVQQEQKGWTDAEHDLVVARLQYVSKIHTGEVWPLEDALADPPLPTWTKMSSGRKLQIASEAGLLGEALRFEQQQGKDPELVAKLEKKIAAEQAEREAEEALVAS